MTATTIGKSTLVPVGAVIGVSALAVSCALWIVDRTQAVGIDVQRNLSGVEQAVMDEIGEVKGAVNGNSFRLSRIEEKINLNWTFPEMSAWRDLLQANNPEIDVPPVKQHPR